MRPAAARTAVSRLMRYAWLGALVATLMSCVTRATVVVVDLASDAPPTRAVTVSVSAMDGTSGTMHWHALADGGPLRLPASFGVTPAPGGENRPATITLDVSVSPAAPGEPQLRFAVVARFAFIPHTTTRIPLYVSIACGAPARGCTTAGVPCTVAEFCHEHDQTCTTGGRCASQSVMPPDRDGGDVGPNDGCARTCTDRMCGPDGCGGTCGSCAMGDTCNGLGQCVNLHCTPTCTGHNCGPDGCGGTCGTCAANQTCNASGQCTVGPCVPNCAGHTCGSDGCTGSCGSCPSGQACNTAGHCAVVCSGSCAGRSCGDDGCGGSCGTCTGSTACNSAGQCVSTCSPNCAGRNCGTDGCGGSCGACLASQICSSSGLCSGGCNPNCAGRNCGGDGCGGSCGTCSGAESCVSGVCTCNPNCAGRSCGGDGCGGSCGACPATFVCDGGGNCACPAGQTVCPNGLCASCCVTSCGTSTVCGCASGAEINNYCHDACGAFNESAHMIPTCANVHSVAGTDNCGGPCTADCIDDGSCMWSCVDGGPAVCPPDRGMDCGVASGPVAAGECVCN